MRLGVLGRSWQACLRCRVNRTLWEAGAPQSGAESLVASGQHVSLQESPEIMGTLMRLRLRVRLTESSELHLSSSNLFFVGLFCCVGDGNTGLCACLANALLLSHTPTPKPVDSRRVGLPVGPEKGWVAGCWLCRWGRSLKRIESYHDTVCLSNRPRPLRCIFHRWRPQAVTDTMFIRDMGRDPTAHFMVLVP